jgi:hypothetical protein
MLQLTQTQRERLLDQVMTLFQAFCKETSGTLLYAYQIRIARACLGSLLVDRKNVYIKISRQAGKTAAVSLLIQFLMVFLLHLRSQRLMLGIASPNGEQAKTDVDRLKLSLGKGQKLHTDWELEDTESNAKTMRIIRRAVLHAEVFVFSLAPTTNNESKTLNVLAVEEAHKINDKKCDDELVPMLSSTGGVSWRIGVGCTRMCDFKQGCDGQLPKTESIVVPVDDVIRDRRAMYEQTGDPAHLAYESWFTEQLAKYGRNNPEIRRNFYLEDTVEEGNFISRDRLLSCARTTPVSMERLFFGIDWARFSDHTWAAVGNDQNDVVDWLKIPHVPYIQQVELVREWVTRDRGGWTYADRILGVRGDSTGGTGDAPNEMLQQHSGLPVGSESFVQFTLQSKDRMYTLFEQALFRDEGDPLRFSYPADHELTAEFEEQMVALTRTYKGDGEYLSVHHPDEPNAKDDAPDCTCLMLTAAAGGGMGDILFG